MIVLWRSPGEVASGPAIGLQNDRTLILKLLQSSVKRDGAAKPRSREASKLWFASNWVRGDQEGMLVVPQFENIGLARGDFAVPFSTRWDGGVLMNQFPFSVSLLEAIRFAHHEVFRISSF